MRSRFSRLLRFSGERRGEQAGQGPKEDASIHAETRSPSLPGRKDRLPHSEAPALQMNDAFPLPSAMPVLSVTGMLYA